MEISRAKLIISGSIWEYYSFARVEPLIPSEIDSKEISALRSKKALMRKINANAGQWVDDHGRSFIPLFVTLTFKRNLQDVKTANNHFHNFVRRFNYTIFNTKKSHLKYTNVIEFQHRGAVHYHSVFYNVPFVSGLPYILRSIWSYGSQIDIKAISDMWNVGSYLTKYLSKSATDHRLYQKKRHFSSQGLIKPTIITDEVTISEYLSALPSSSLDYIYQEGGFNYERHNLSSDCLASIPALVRRSVSYAQAPKVLSYQPMLL